MFNIFDLNSHLDSDEKIIIFFRPSRKAYIMHYIFFIFLVLVAFVFMFYGDPSSNLFILYKFINVAATALLIFALIMIFRLEYRIMSRKYALTTERILYCKGIFIEVFRSLSYSYITDIQCIQTFWDQIMNTGTLMINTAGATDYEIRYRKISDPLDVKKRINDMQNRKSETKSTPQIHKTIVTQETAKKGKKKR